MLSVATSHHRSQLLLIILIAVSGFAALLSFVGVIYIIKRKSKKKTDTNEDDSSDDKEEPVKEYKVGGCAVCGPVTLVTSVLLAAVPSPGWGHTLGDTMFAVSGLPGYGATIQSLGNLGICPINDQL